MGDTRRNEVFVSFLRKQFPKAKSFLVIADGKGELARLLANKRYKVRVVEAKPRFAGRVHKRIKYQKGWFISDHIIAEDVIVAMHPDEATSEVILAATTQNKSFAVVPCCLKGRHSRGVQTFACWIKKLKILAKNKCLEGMLKFSGKNVVLWNRVYS